MNSKRHAYRFAGTVFGSVAALALCYASPAEPGKKGFLAGAAVGAVGTIIIQELTKGGSRPAKKQRRRYRGSGNSAPVARTTIATFPTTRDEVRDYQSSLNALGFDAGTPDGIAGRRTRAAVAEFQATIGSPETGRLSRNDAAELQRRSGQPLLSAGPDGSSIENGGPMPTINTVGGAPQPSFPTIPLAGGAAATAATHGGQNQFSQFPPAGATESSSGFSATLGDAGVGSNTANSTGSSSAPSFPVVGLPQTGSAQQAAPSFPVISTPDTDGIGTNPVSPELPAVTDGSGGNLSTAALTQEIESGGTVETSSLEFDILGVSIGQAKDAALATLAKEGYENCDTSGEVMICEKSNEALSDKVLIGTGTAPADRVYLVARDLEFTKPMARNVLAGRMSESYGAILSQPDNVIASADCRSTVMGMTGESTSAGLAFAGTDPASMTDVARQCASYSGIRFRNESSDKVKGATITLFSGAMWQETAGAGVMAQESVVDELKF